MNELSLNYVLNFSTFHCLKGKILDPCFCDLNSRSWTFHISICSFGEGEKKVKSNFSILRELWLKFLFHKGFDPLFI